MPRDEREFHRKIAARSFNLTWDYLDMKKRTTKDDLEMLSAAHSSRYHWHLVGTPRNLAIADWQVSRVYAAIRQPQLSLQFAESSLDLCEGNGLADIIHTAYEALARAYAVAENYPKAEAYLRKARQQLDSLKLDKAERKLYLDQIHQTELIAKKQ